MQHKHLLASWFTVLAVGLSIALLSPGQAAAQDTTHQKKKSKVARAADTTGHAISKTAKKVGNKTAEVASKGASTIADKTYKGKEGPDGQTVYIDKKDRKYYVNDKGKKIYLKASQIKDKKE